MAWQAVVFVAVLLLIFSRRPQDFLHAVFYAEDGNRWFAQAYNLSWLRSLSVPDAAYLQVLPRLAAGLALWVPLGRAPFVMNLAGAVIQALPVTALLTRRCSNWGPLPVRMVLATLYVVIPNAPEIHVNVTNAQWHFALLEVLLAFGLPPRTWAGRVLDLCVFLVGAFSGPFGIALLPALLLFWWLRRQRWTLVVAACLTVGMLVQVHTIVTDGRKPLPYEPNMPQVSARAAANRTPLGATPRLLVQIVGGDMVINSMVGYTNAARFPFLLCVAGLLLGGVVLTYGLRWGPLALRLLALETLLLTVAALKSPAIIYPPADRWTGLMISGGMRYYFLPSIVFLWAAVYCMVRTPARFIRRSGYCILLLTALGAVRRWEYPRYDKDNFEAAVLRFNQARSGEHIVLPMHPNQYWTVTLVKH